MGPTTDRTLTHVNKKNSPAVPCRDLPLFRLFFFRAFFSRVLLIQGFLKQGLEASGQSLGVQ